ncbi:helix-turn-helix domain-containing protein [Brevibacillus parabrevis]|uniref:AraC family transcriptional regulator n=1 Tax=Brevibacillus parabrevis TaxID=54914 RepID=UPI0028D6027B|nr:helix-turn-helix domain-containing protein [Brevibacillus parabrevis]
MLRYSVSHLSALFKKKTGYSLIDYLIRVRMEKAASLLVETDRQLREIAESVGYREPYYFGRLFKKVYGISPARFRATKAQTPQTADRPATIIGSSIAAAKERVHKVIPEGKSFSELTDKQMFVYGDNFGRGGQAVYQALGLKPPAAIAKTLQEKQWLELSSELLSQYAGDYIILTSNSHTLEDLKKDPLWSSLDAVKNNHVYVWKEERSLYYDPIAVLSQTEEIADWLTKQ